MNDLPVLPELANEGGTPASARVRDVLADGRPQHDAGALVPPAQASAGGDGEGQDVVAVEARCIGGIWHARRVAANGRAVTGIGYTRRDAEDDFWNQWSYA